MNPSTADRLLPVLLLALTAVTGFVDAVSYLALGHVFTANMTGNVVFLGFAMAKVPELSVARSGTALGAFVIGATLGGRLEVGRKDPTNHCIPRVVPKHGRWCCPPQACSKLGRTVQLKQGHGQRRWIARRAETIVSVFD